MTSALGALSLLFAFFGARRRRRAEAPLLFHRGERIGAVLPRLLAFATGLFECDHGVALRDLVAQTRHVRFVVGVTAGIEARVRLLHLEFVPAGQLLLSVGPASFERRKLVVVHALVFIGPSPTQTG